MWDLAKFATNTALIDEWGNSLSYEELNNAVNHIIAHVDNRALVFCMCENKIGSVVGYTAFIEGNIVPVLLNSHMDCELLNALLETYKPRYLWLPKEQAAQYENMSSLLVLYDYSLLQTNYGVQQELYEELALLLTTSGSTGSPKFVRQSYANIKANTESIIEYLNIDSSERAITTLPMNYTYGLSIINTHLMVGATILLTDKTLVQKEFWNFFREERATSFGGVPYTYEMLDRLRFYRMDLPYLRYMTQAGGKLTPELHEKMAKYAQEAGKEFIVMYGQCEATARMGYLPAKMAVQKRGSMGVAIPGGKFRLIDAEGKDIQEPEVVGELVYEGANVTLGYAECMEDLAKGDERGGILQTGDMAKRDEDGYFYIVGRKKRFLKVYGNRVNLDEIDRMIKAQFDNIDCASAGVDDHMYLFVTREELAHPVKSFIVEKTKLNPMAFKTVVIDEIPKNDAGKTLYKELAKYYEK